MKKIIGSLILAAGVALPMACSNNNNPTSPAATATFTAVPTSWAGYTATNTPTSTPSATPTATNAGGYTSTFTPTSTVTGTPTVTATPTNTTTSTATVTPTNTSTPFTMAVPPFKQSGPTVKYPNAVACNSATTFLYVAEGDGSSVSMVQVFNAGLGAVTTLTAYGSTTFGNPYGVAVNSAGTTLYVVDSIKNEVFAFNASTYAPVTAWTGYGAVSFSAPEGIAVDGPGNVYVADTGNNKVEEFDLNGNTLAQWSGNDSGYTSFDQPSAVAAAGGNVYVADAGNEIIRAYSNLGSGTPAFAPVTTVSGSDLFGLAVDGSGNIYAADGFPNSQVEVYSNTGSLLTAWNGSSGPYAFFIPDGIALTPAGDIWVTDFQNGPSPGTLTDF